jgi:polysaccharide export outer membrane protein
MYSMLIDGFKICLLGLWLSGCSGLRLGTTQSDPLPGTASAADATKQTRSFKLGTGDVIDIKVFREPELAGIYRVNPHAEITFPLIGQVKLTGKDPYQIAEEIRARLANGYLQNPQVTVFVREYHSQKVHILGQVAKAGSQGFQPGMTIIQAVASAGGFTNLAATNRVRVTRVIEGAEQKYIIPVGDIRNGNAPNFTLRPGDIVYIPEAIF